MCLTPDRVSRKRGRNGNGNDTKGSLLRRIFDRWKGREDSIGEF